MHSSLLSLVTFFGSQHFEDFFVLVLLYDTKFMDKFKFMFKKIQAKNRNNMGCEKSLQYNLENLALYTQTKCWST